MNGVIKKVVPSRGFGFMAAEDGTEYFFHRDELRGLEFANLKPGQRVTFDAQQGPKGPRGGQRVSDGVEQASALT
ncbi:MAG: cold-shock protein [Acidobacteria bacterium]|nr:MAG: cold-shock protein [Acidobacteriota bacterium]